MEKITRFRNEYDFLSNFYPCTIQYNGHTYPSAETAYQAEKCAKEEDRLAISTMTPKDAKRYGRKILQKSNWHIIKVRVMHEIVEAKFTQNPDLKEKLFATGDAELLEGNTWNDRYWGVSLKMLEGKNMLGEILMDVRSKLNI